MLQKVVLIAGASVILYGIAVWDMVLLGIGIVAIAGTLVLGSFGGDD